jgi:hypothetical protein
MSHNAMGGIKVRLRNTAMPALTMTASSSRRSPSTGGLIEHCVPPKVATLHERFHWCEGCNRIYWE